MIETGFYAVDIFLFIGGYVSILANTKYIMSFQKTSPNKWPAIYLFALFKRWIRIMPAYAVMMLYYWKVGPALTYGPFVSQTHLCTPTTFWESWIIGWRASITEGTLCSGWCWYLAVDFQLYLTIPIICLICKKNRQLGIYVCSALIAACTIGTIVVCYVKDLYWLNWNDQSMNVYYYAKSYLRGSVYYMGCLISYLTMRGSRGGGKKKKKEVKQEGQTEDLAEPLLNPEEVAEKERLEKEKKDRRRRRAKKRAALLGNIALVLGLAFMTLDTLALHYYFQWGRPSKEKVSHFGHVMFITFGKVIFVFSFMAILMPIAAKYKAFGNFIAKNRLLQLIGNVSFGGYLYHFTVIMLRLNS
jgi:peptidoglycan/LPS O-acetylase OafA/YrhL